MKTIFTILALLLFQFLSYAQITRLAPLATEGSKTKPKKQPTVLEINKILRSHDSAIAKVNAMNTLVNGQSKDTPIDKTSIVPHFAISGLGSVSSTSDKIDNVDPAANITANLSLSASRKWLLYLNYNIGTTLDTISKDSLSLPAIFFPDKSKSGFTAGYSIDVLRIWKKNLKHTLSNVTLTSEDDSSKYYYYTLEPYFEYSYMKRTLEHDSITDIPRIETSTEVLGIRATGNLVLDKNSFAFSGNPYIKFVKVTDATYGTYNSLFYKNSNNNKKLPHNVSFLGVNVNLQINKTILSFNYVGLLGKKIIDRNVSGGVFTLKAIIATDFFNFD